MKHDFVFQGKIIGDAEKVVGFIPGHKILPKVSILKKIIAKYPDAGEKIMGRFEELHQSSMLQDLENVQKTSKMFNRIAFWNGFFSVFGFSTRKSLKMAYENPAIEANHRSAHIGNMLRQAMFEFVGEHSDIVSDLNEEELTDLFEPSPAPSHYMQFLAKNYQ